MVSLVCAIWVAVVPGPAPSAMGAPHGRFDDVVELRVIDAITGIAIPGAAIEVQGTEGHPAARVRTDRRGIARVPREMLSRMARWFTVQARGYAPARRPLRIPPGIHLRVRQRIPLLPGLQV